MAAPSTTYADVRVILDQALKSEKGIMFTPDDAKCQAFISRCNRFRERLREEAGSAGDYEYLALTIIGDAVRIRRRSMGTGKIIPL